MNDIGMDLAEKLIGQHLRLTWEHRVIAADSLWLVGVTDACSFGAPRKFHVTRIWVNDICGFVRFRRRLKIE